MTDFYKAENRLVGAIGDVGEDGTNLLARQIGISRTLERTVSFKEASGSHWSAYRIEQSVHYHFNHLRMYEADDVVDIAKITSR
ncbi:hypothetical protein [Pseudomonas ogarae]